jgi:hypothetical protein
LSIDLIIDATLSSAYTMFDWSPTILNSIFILLGIVLAHSLFLYSQFYKNSEGYMLRAARKLWFFLLTFFVIEWVIGAFFFFLAAGLPQYASVPLLIFGGIIGIIVAAIPTALEHVLLPKTGSTVETLGRPLTRLLLKLNIVLRYNFAWAIESCREEDAFDCQKPDGWGLNIPPKQVGRRIRMLYELSKIKIAESYKNPAFLQYDVGRNPWDQFYLLVRHVGRKRLREYIKNPLNSPCPNWDGRERRRRGGTKEDRDNSIADNEPYRSRIYDDQDRIKRITDGEN